MTRTGGLEETRPTGNGRSRGLVSSRASGARVDARMFAAPADLDDVVERLWEGSWDLRGQADHAVEMIGDPAIHLAFEDGRGRVVGVWDRMWTRTLSGRGRVRAAKLRPGAAQAFLPGDAIAYINRMTPLADLFDDAGALAARVLGPDDPEAGLLALAAWLRAQRRADPGGVVASRLVERARASHISRVDALAATEGRSVRAVQRLFRRHVGASPKWVVRWIRLQEAAVRVEAGDVLDLAQLAYDLDYSDQAHLARDFRAATGRTLTAFAASVHAPL